MMDGDDQAVYGGYNLGDQRYLVHSFLTVLHYSSVKLDMNGYAVLHQSRTWDFH